jgi:FkbM family methyltransferase
MADHHQRKNAEFLHFRDFLAELARPLPRDVLQTRVENLFHDLCKRIEPTVSVEIGAHEARFSRRLKHHSPEVRALAFEANPYVFEKHHERATSEGVEYRHLAVGPTNGTVELTIPTSIRHTERPLANRMASLGRHVQADDAQVVEVECVRLDDHLERDSEDRIVAWIDVEGANEAVLRGSEHVLSQVCAIYIEVEQELRWEGQWLDVDVARFLADAGFIPIARDTQRPHQYNLVLVSPELASDPRVARMVAHRYRPAPTAS